MLGFVLLGWFLWPFVVRGATFPLGPDAPVYLWWIRLADLEGLSVVRARPGVPGLALVVANTLGLSVVQVTAALEVALGVAVGTAAFALVRRSVSPAWAALAGLLAGTFGVHLAAGYLANLAVAAAFVAALELVDAGGRRAVPLAAAVLGGGGLAHPPFFLVSAAILLLAAVTAWRSDRDEAVALGWVALGGGALLGGGLLAVVAGAAPLEVDTSKDAFLRRAELTGELRAAYLDRFVHRWTRYVQWASVPLAVAGFGAGTGSAGRVLRSWFAVTVAGVAISLATAWLPADRFVTFGFAIPILAALGLARLRRVVASRRALAAGRALAAAITTALALAMLAGAFIAWNRQEPFVSEAEVRAATVANAEIADLTPRTPLAFLVFDGDDSVTFLATRAGNVIRAAVPPDRIRDVVVVVTPLDGASPTRRALEGLTARDLALAESRAGRPAETFVLTPFDAVDRPPDAHVAEPEDVPAAAVEPLEPSSPEGIAWAALLTLALLALVGFGWARLATRGAVVALAVAPAVGGALLILVAVALDALGARIGSAPVALAASAACAVGGYALDLVPERGARTQPPHEVEQQPTE